MKTIIKITKSVLSFAIICVVSLAICTVVALLVLYIFGLSDTTARWCTSILFFGTILVALLLGAFDN